MSAIWILRPIRPTDGAAVAAIIRDVMTEHDCSGPGFAIHDPEVADMPAAYAASDAGYFVVEHAGEVLGGGGYARLLGTTVDDATCELRKMYFRPAARGRGLGHALLELLLAEMRGRGYRRCYLETTSWMQAAQHVYRAHGFTPRPDPCGATGHHGCDAFFEREL
ncbi:MAG: GNAT family N-acetyltransferase [Planctomycetes bacterium]|nr:GNAT family N-acetyltransferase [Planctomycetota bacterium]